MSVFEDMDVVIKLKFYRLNEPYVTMLYTNPSSEIM